MNVILRTSSKMIEGTNIRKSDIHILPHDATMRALVENSLCACIHQNALINNDHHVEYAMNLACFPTTTNIPYIIWQLFKDNILHTRLDYTLFKTRVAEYALTKAMVNELFSIMIKLRLFRVMYIRAHVLIIKRNTSSWDVHFVRQLHERVVRLEFALTDPRMRSFLLQYKRTLASNITKFIKRMVDSRLGFTNSLDVISTFWQIGTTSLNIEMSLTNDPSYYMVLLGPFDSNAIITFYKHQLDIILDMHKFPKLFEKDITEFKHTYSFDYMKEVIQCIPNMWEHVQESFKKMSS